ncbi:Hypothetical predicted protein, partial [Pelobates cultripes]
CMIHVTCSNSKRDSDQTEKRAGKINAVCADALLIPASAISAQLFGYRRRRLM